MTRSARWREAEARGFRHAWTYDHLSWRSLRDGPWLGAVPLLSAVAASTSTLRIGTLVTSPNFRHPALLAKDVMTIDEISGGRLDLGIGAGGLGYDASALGGKRLALADRFVRFEEFVDALDVMLREPVCSYGGRYFEAVGSRTLPGCAQQPRVLFTIAAAGARAMSVAARYGDAWVTFGPTDGGSSPEEWFVGVAQQVALLERACRYVGRAPTKLRRAALVSLEASWAQGSIMAWDDFCGKLDHLGFTDVIVHWPRAADADLPGPPPAVFDEISRRLS